MSVGHAALIGIGAYTAAILADRLGIGFWLALPFSILSSAGRGPDRPAVLAGRRAPLHHHHLRLLRPV